MFSEIDVLVIGGGHAGCEAAMAAANLGCKTLLISQNLYTLAQMSCNPAVGGIAKGQLVREIDALGGYMGIVTDLSTLQFRMLNRSKGPGMWSPRAQCDKRLFSDNWRHFLDQNPNVSLWQDTVSDIIVSRETISGIYTEMGLKIKTKAVVITAGTFLNGIIHIGEKQSGGGRIGERKAVGITEALIQLGMRSGRLKTGTPPRIDSKSLDFSKMDIQEGDENPAKFSFLEKIQPVKKQLPCFITYTNDEVHRILEKGFDRSPMYSGRIEGTGPRYCPSIEDKIGRFADKERHQLFVEPEGWKTSEMYINGFSTSLPLEIQVEAMNKVPGFEHCSFIKPGYAIEYDFFPPTQLKITLETKAVRNLFLAGQINGTTGYEEAGCQGLIAGMNAALQVQEKDSFILGRDEAYIGVLIDDLINKGTDEPYRMFTSRAEYRTLLRQDNADGRLTEKSYTIGLADEERMRILEKKSVSKSKIRNYWKETAIAPDNFNQQSAIHHQPEVKEKVKTERLLLRPGIGWQELKTWFPDIATPLLQEPTEAIEAAEIELKYETYIVKEREIAQRMKTLEDLKIPEHLNYMELQALSTEARMKLSEIRPQTLGQASRISGVNPSDIQVLMIKFGR